MKPESNVFKNFVPWPLTGHKWHTKCGNKCRSNDWQNVFDSGKQKLYKWHKPKEGEKGRDDSYNVFDVPVKKYKWHHRKITDPKGRSDEYNVMANAKYGDHNPEYDIEHPKGFGGR